MLLRKANKKLFLAIFIISCTLFFNSIVYASSNDVEVALKIEQHFEYDNNISSNIDKKGTYKLQALEENIPMPDGSKDKEFTFNLEGKSSEITIPLRYEHGGVYAYKLEQITADKENYTFDRNSYKITVYVKNSGDNKLIPQVIVENSDNKKCGEIVFNNVYKTKLVLKPQDKEQNISIPQDNNPVKTNDSMSNIIYLIVAVSFTMILLLYGIKKKHNK